MFIIDIQNKVPIFEQLKKQILEFISIGILLPNDKLPPVRSLATVNSSPLSGSRLCIRPSAPAFTVTNSNFTEG